MDVTQIAQRLIAFETVNPPGDEAAAMRFCGYLLDRAGFDCRYIEHGPSRASLIATRNLGRGHAIAFSGHLDTVPLGTAKWQHDPFGAEIADNRLYGRGSCDMKGGIASFLVAAIEAAPVPGGVAILLTAGEETGSDGARWMVEDGGLPLVGALVVAEPTMNMPRQGHKGVLWLKLTATGVTAHGSMPEKGVNAIQKAARAVLALDGFEPGPAHPVMGTTSASVGTIHGGLNTNSVPDSCEVSIDLRTVAGMDHGALINDVVALVGPDIMVEPILNLAPVWTEPVDRWMIRASAIRERLTGEAAVSPAAMPYFTDASYLKPALGDPPTLILGPGDPALAHQTDEWVAIDRLNAAKAIYGELIRSWQGWAA